MSNDSNNAVMYEGEELQKESNPIISSMEIVERDELHNGLTIKLTCKCFDREKLQLYVASTEASELAEKYAVREGGLINVAHTSHNRQIRPERRSETDPEGIYVFTRLFKLKSSV